MLGVALLFVGLSCIAVADVLDGVWTAPLAMAGAWITVAGIAMATYNYGLTKSTFYDPNDVPTGRPTPAVEDFAKPEFQKCKTLASGMGTPTPKADARQSLGADKDIPAAESDLRTQCKPKKPKAFYKAELPARERLWDDSPASMAFDSLLIRALYAHKIPDVSTLVVDECPADRPNEEQIRGFLEAIMGREALLPSVGTTVPLKVTCVLLRGCKTLKDFVLKVPHDRAILEVEFICVRDGDVMGVHYEAHIVSDPMSLVWFNRLGELPSADAYSCTTLPRRAV
jgi:hypothetical protein